MKERPGSRGNPTLDAREVDLGNYHPVSEHKESECKALNDKQIAKPVLNRTKNHYIDSDFNTVVALVRCIQGGESCC